MATYQSLADGRLHIACSVSTEGADAPRACGRGWVALDAATITRWQRIGAVIGALGSAAIEELFDGDVEFVEFDTDAAGSAMERPLHADWLFRARVEPAQVRLEMQNAARAVGDSGRYHSEWLGLSELATMAAKLCANTTRAGDQAAPEMVLLVDAFSAWEEPGVNLDKARLTVTQGLLDRIEQMAVVVTATGALGMDEFNYHCEFLKAGVGEEVDEEEQAPDAAAQGNALDNGEHRIVIRTELDVLRVQDREFRFQANLNGTEVVLNTEFFDIANMKARYLAFVAEAQAGM